jgi:hypothetical protein
VLYRTWGAYTNLPRYMTMQAAAQFCFDDGPFPFAISVMIVVLLFGRKTRRILKPSYTTYAIVHLINGYYILQVYRR